LAAWWLRTSLSAARREIASGHYGVARGRLARLSAWNPGLGEVEFPLGLCEQAEGNLDAAVAAWARVPERSPFREKAALERARVEIDRGRFAKAEEVLSSASRDPGPMATQLRHDLLQLLWHELRFDEVRRLIEVNWRELSKAQGSDAPTVVDTLRAHLSLDLEPYALEQVEAALKKASQSAPEDDRVWLALANLATRTGRFDDANNRLARVLQKRPSDPVAWKSKLDLAVASNRVGDVLESLDHLADDQLSPREALRVRAWLASRSGDARVEKESLAALVGLDSGETSALDRLADLEIQAGQTDRAAELRRRKARLDDVKHRYTTMVSSDFVTNAGELARLAEALDRRFEERAFLTMLNKRRPGDQSAREGLARLAGREKPTATAPSPSDIVREFSPKVHNGDVARSLADRPTPPRFVDDAASAGLRFVFRSGRSPERQLPETMSGGLALIDYDGDGWLDVYAAQGGTFPPDSSHAGGGDRLFRNRGDGTLEDRTEAAGLRRLARGYGLGVAVGDYDNDGRPDLFLTRWRAYTLLRNKGDGTFEDVTARAGLGGDRDWPTSAAWADLDGDGDLDLYVCHYLVWDPDNPRLCKHTTSDENTYCAPRLFQSLPDHVFRNDGGRFVDVTTESGILDQDGRGLGVLAADLDGDHRVDLFVANDGSANYLFRNLGGFRFEETGHASGVAGNAEGGYQAGMGIACGDLDGDGRPDVVVTNFYGESSSYFQNLGGGMFADRTAAVGLLAASRFRLGFGVAFEDVNNDGRLDLLTAYGHVNDLRPTFAYAMPAQLLLGTEGGRLVDVSDRAGPAWSKPRVGRGLAAGDLDNDGRLDAVILDQNEPLAYVHNRSDAVGHFVTFRLEGTRSNRDAVGAEVTVVSGGRRQVAQRFGGGSYISSGDPRLHFGLGAADRIERVEVRWPSGRADTYRDLPADTGYLLREGDPTPSPLAASRSGSRDKKDDEIHHGAHGAHREEDREERKN
jgi:tetratricopeptide (TPR) repeat protein